MKRNVSFGVSRFGEKHSLGVIRWHISDERVLVEIERFQHPLTLTGDILPVVENQNAVFVVSLRRDSMKRFHGNSFRGGQDDRTVS